ncbi:MAG: hypothetical protein HYT80_00805 [Euryarchaeota archaeon]|nr:hypothetical protein [Euryarchaeota archaeon]
MGAVRPAFVLVLGLLLGSPAALALGPGGLPHDPTPQAPNAIDATYDVRVPTSLDALEVVVKLVVHEVQLEGNEGVPAQAIRDGGQPIRAAFEAAVAARMAKELKAAFPESTPGPVQLQVRYGDSDADENLYNPPILVEGASRVPLSPFMMGVTSTKATNAAELARAFLYSGGRISFDRPIAVPAGFNARVVVTVPEFLQLNAGQTNATRLVFPRDNSLGVTSQNLRLHFSLGLDPAHLPANVELGPKVRATFVAHDDTPLWMQLIPVSNGRYSADLDLWIELHSLPLEDFTASPVPGRIGLTHVSADLLRVAVRERLIYGDDLHAYFANLITESLKEGFGPAAQVRMDTAVFEESLAQKIGGADGQTVEPLLVHANAKLPLKSDKMVFGSAIARALGMIAGMPARFPIGNDGAWSLELTLLYPEGVGIDASDSLGRLQEVERDGREGFTLSLAPGEMTKVRVQGRPEFHVGLFVLGALEIGALLALGWWLTLKVQALRSRVRAPWAPR